MSHCVGIFWLLQSTESMSALILYCLLRTRYSSTLIQTALALTLRPHNIHLAISSSISSSSSYKRYRLNPIEIPLSPDPHPPVSYSMQSLSLFEGSQYLFIVLSFILSILYVLLFC